MTKTEWDRMPKIVGQEVTFHHMNYRFTGTIESFYGNGAVVRYVNTKHSRKLSGKWVQLESTSVPYSLMETV